MGRGTKIGHGKLRIALICYLCGNVNYRLSLRRIWVAFIYSGGEPNGLPDNAVALLMLVRSRPAKSPIRSPR